MTIEKVNFKIDFCFFFLMQRCKFYQALENLKGVVLENNLIYIYA